MVVSAPVPRLWMDLCRPLARWGSFLRGGVRWKGWEPMFTLEWELGKGKARPQVSKPQSPFLTL